MANSDDRASLRDPEERPRALFFAVCNLLVATGVSYLTFRALPIRYLPVDATAVLVTALNLASGIAFFMRSPKRGVVIRICAWGLLAMGLVLIALLALSVSYLSGVYGGLGKGGAVIFALVIAILAPFLVVLPAAELVFTRSIEKRGCGGR